MAYLQWNGQGDLYDWLQEVGANPRRTTNGYSIKCLNTDHEDERNSAKIFDDLWWTCFGTCGRHNVLTKQAFDAMGTNYKPSEDNYQVKAREEEDTVVVDYYDYWLSLDPLDEGIKGIPASTLNKLGWRKLPGGNQLHLPAGIFIPAFNASRTRIPFCQVRHLEGDRRFSFPSRVKPLAFGMESVQQFTRYVAFTEGNSDRAVLEAAGIPAIAIPSGSSGKLLRSIGEWAVRENLLMVAVSDNDAVGDKLLRSLDGVAPYIDARVNKYKDIGEKLEAEGISSIVREYSWLRPNQPSS